MAVNYPAIGNKVTAKIIEVGGACSIGMKVGDEFELSVHQCGDFCGYFYHNIFQWVTLLQFDGTFPLFPDKDVMVWECPNSGIRVKVELRREKR
ncbi:MAG: TIGR04076 family protein [Deltaproteobacteria bacterium]|nr:TIGR04076 family protein [Candidatus Tharpella aukensis]